jgi:hypothetical protein
MQVWGLVLKRALVDTLAFVKQLRIGWRLTPAILASILAYTQFGLGTWHALRVSILSLLEVYITAITGVYLWKVESALPTLSHERDETERTLKARIAELEPEQVAPPLPPIGYQAASVYRLLSQASAHGYYEL